jgi:outer membrane protein OmpA-like peptidoglycan-associated protein/outer membrane protein assembly factor BamD (BamD/ComL family)
LDYYDEQKYDKAWAGFTEAVAKEKDLPVAYYGMAMCFLNSESRYKDYDSAYFYAQKSLAAFKKDNYDYYYESKYGLVTDSAVYMVKLTEKNLYNDIVSSANLAKAKSFVKNYPKSEYTPKITEMIDELAFKDASSQNTAAAYETFCKDYPKSKYFAQAKELCDKLTFEEFTRANTYQVYQLFCEKYPQSSYFAKAKDKYELLLFESMTQAGTLSEYEKFCVQYPKSPYWRVAQDSIYHMAVHIGDINSYKQFVAQHPESPYTPALQDSLLHKTAKESGLAELERYISQYPTAANADKVIKSIYAFYAHSGDLADLELFEKKYPGKETQALQKDKAIANEWLTFSAATDAETLTAFIKKAAPKDIAFFAMQLLAKPKIEATDWVGAANTLQPLVSYFGSDNQKVNELIDILKKYERPEETQKLEAVCSTGNEYNPVISLDGKNLYFSANGRTNNLGGDDIFVSKMQGNWQAPTIVPTLSTPSYNDVLTSVSGSGNEMLLSQEGDIMISKKTATGWTLPQSVSDKINSTAWEGDASFTANNQAILFASDRKGCVGFAHDCTKDFAGTGFGNSDLYVSVKTASGWSSPINLGNVVNTSFAERSPYLHADMKTLYFCTNGQGLGNFDVYKTTRMYDTSWVYWTKPENIGKLVNTSGKDMGITVSTDGEYAYYSLTSSNQKDIYRTKLPVAAKPKLVFSVSGKLSNSLKKPVDAVVRWENMETGEILGETSSDITDGSFFIALPAGKIYGFYAEKDGYYPVGNHLDLRSGQSVVTPDGNFGMFTFAELIKTKKTVPLNNVMFNSGDYHVLPVSNSELNRIADMLKRNMSLRIEIVGYSETPGADGDMLKYQRASEIKSYLVQRGCKTENIVVTATAAAKKAPAKKGAKPAPAPKCVQLKFLGF